MKAPALSRRGLVAGLVAYPLASLPPATAATVSSAEAAFLALGPVLVPLLEEHERLWAPCRALYEAAEQACSGLRWPAREATSEWRAYIAGREPADAVEQRLMALYEPFIDTPLTSFEGIRLRHRFGMALDGFRECALDDLDRLWGRPCA